MYCPCFPATLGTESMLVRDRLVLSEAETRDAPRRTITVKNKLAASTCLAPWGNSSETTDEASLQNPPSPRQRLTPAPLAGSSMAVTYNHGQKGGSERA